MNSAPKFDANFYTQKDFIAYGDRLHINTALNTTINVIAIYIVLKHSTEAMKNYKPYILMTLITSFWMDFHITFIFGPFLMLPSNSMCGAGIICRHFGYLWGQLFPYALLHICISFVGFSIVLGFLYQYFSVTGNSNFFSSFRNRIIMLVIIILYPTPSIYIGFAHASNDFSMKTIAEDYPYLLPIFSNNGCYYVKIDAGGREFIISQVLQIVGVAIIAYTIAFKLHRKLASLKNVLSPATLKARKQFFIALLLQFTIPSAFLVGPPVTALTLILFEYENAHLLSNYIMPIIALHSAFNALIVMFVITPYRLTLIRWFRYIFRIKQNPVIGLQPSLLSTSLTQHIEGQLESLGEDVTQMSMHVHWEKSIIPDWLYEQMLMKIDVHSTFKQFREEAEKTLKIKEQVDSRKQEFAKTYTSAVVKSSGKRKPKSGSVIFEQSP